MQYTQLPGFRIIELYQYPGNHNSNVDIMDVYGFQDNFLDKLLI